MSSAAIGDLSEAGQLEMRADLLAGSAGYQHFLKQLSGFISPAEAGETYKRFRSTARLFWWMLVLFCVAYIAINQLLGPRGLTASAWGNDFLRGSLFLAVAVLTRKRRVSVAGQLLLPLAALCFLPMPVQAEEDWWQMPLEFGGMLVWLYAAGWCMDAGTERGRGWLATISSHGLPPIAVLMFIALNIAAWLWITDEAVFPLLSILFALGAIPWLGQWRGEKGEMGDVDFLYAAAWKRWRFLVIGRGLAIVMGVVPFLLFANLLDYQEELQLASEVEKAPEILRMDEPGDKWLAFFWRDRGRFLRETDFHPVEEKNGVISAFFLTKAGGSASGAAAWDEAALRAAMLELNKGPMTRKEFDDHLKEYLPLQITSRESLLLRTRDPFDLLSQHLVVMSFHPRGKEGGVCFAETPQLVTANPETLDRLITRYNVPKWIFFAFGVVGFILLWRRGGDSSLARWMGAWLVGVSLVPTMMASDDTLPQITHWLWQQSVMYRWNTLGSTAGPLFTLLLAAAFGAAILWLLQITQAVCWAYICWPTRIYPQYPAVVRQLMIVGKLAVVLTLNFIIFCVTVIPFGFFMKGDHDTLELSLFMCVSTAVFLASGFVVRLFTSRVSEVPQLGFWPVVAMVAMNLMVLFYMPSLIFVHDELPSLVLSNLGAFFGCLFIGVMGFLILKRDFLRVRAIAGLTMLLLVLLVPLAVHASEKMVTPILVSGPFFRERGAEMVALMLVMLFFPRMHHWLHETLMKISVPKLRTIEHRVEHALEEIVDAEDEHGRIRMISELFEQLHVKHYVFLSRRPHGMFAVDINALGKEIAPTLEVSEALRKFLGHRRHFIDLQTMAFEWEFFFHQFELYRLAESVGGRFLLPISVGESVRGLLLLPDGPGGSVVANPAVSENINNLGIAAALNRPRGIALNRS